VRQVGTPADGCVTRRGLRCCRLGPARALGGQPSTPSQVKAIYASARSRQTDLGPFLQDHFGIGRPNDLSGQEASQASDALKSSPTQEWRTP
jgi:hypothetical protein